MARLEIKLTTGEVVEIVDDASAPEAWAQVKASMANRDLISGRLSGGGHVVVDGGSVAYVEVHAS
jgi:hypothetical protein